MRSLAPVRSRIAALALLAAVVGTLTVPAGAQSKDTNEAARRATAVKDAFAKATRTVQAGAHDLAVYAFGLLGVAYRFGGETPEDGLDCSGLVRHVFQQVTGITLPRTAKEMSGVGGAVARTELVPGDLVFFNTRRFAFSHVGIYVGDARFIHAPRRGRDVEIASLDNSYWGQRFDGARRLIGARAPVATTVAFVSPPFDDAVDLGPTDLR
jgi:cell wall-associated NlpC family hydrolase